MACPYLKRLIVFSCFIFCFGFVRAQNSRPADSLVKRIQQHNKQYIREKIHLHFDKPFYALGDTIWFESYVVNALNNIPASHSRILHVELISPINKVYKAIQLPLNVGFAAGDFALPDSLPAGDYHIRAYTNLLRNFDPGYFFNKSVRIINPFPKAAAGVATTVAAVKTPAALSLNMGEPDIQFFPEGGQLVGGLTSAVAFKALGPGGLGVPVSGKLVDGQNNILLNFASAYAGMGRFTFTPVAGKVYTAVIALPNGTEKRITLAQALPSGYVLTADNSKPDSLYITLQATADLLNKGDLTFMPMANGEPLFFMKTKFPDRHISITAPKDKLPGGIIQLSLLNAQSEPVAERLVFNSYSKQVNMRVEQIKQVYGKREKAEYALTALDAAGKPAIGSFSIAVTNADAVEADERTETTILSNLLLSWELKGYVENPNYYFTDGSAAKSNELDNLLLTQGWRRFVWQDVATAPSALPVYAAEDKISVSGKIKGSGKTNINGVPVTLLAGQLGDGILLDTVTNAAGHFQFYVTDGLRDLPIRVQAKPKRAANYDITIDAYNPPPVINPAITADTMLTTTGGRPALSNYTTAAAAYRKANGAGGLAGKITPLKEVVVKDYDPTHKLRGTHATSANLNGPGQANFIVTAKEIENCRDLTCIAALIPGISVSNKGGLLSFSVLGNVRQAPPLVLIDGTDGDINSVTKEDVESIEYMRTPDYTGTYGIRGSGGVLLITTKKGGANDDALTAKAPNSISFKLPLYLKKEFYSPQYDHPEKAAKMADLRTTVYWKPDVVTDKDGKASVCFYNTDVAGNYRVVIEGISSRGYLCRQVYNYKVE